MVYITESIFDPWSSDMKLDKKNFNLFIFLHMPKFRGSLSIVLAWDWALSGGGLLPLDESAAKFDFRAQKFLQLCQLSSIAGLSSGQLPCYDHLYAFWGRSYLSGSCYGDMPRVMNTILITMMRAVRMGCPRDSEILAKEFGHHTWWRKDRAPCMRGAWHVVD